MPAMLRNRRGLPPRTGTSTWRGPRAGRGRVTVGTPVWHRTCTPPSLTVHPRQGTSRVDPGRSGPLDGTRILAVDDDAAALRMLAAVLSREGATVETADSAKRGLALVEAFAPHDLLSDLSMPGEAGFWLIEQIRSAERRRGVAALPAAAVRR